MSDKMENLGWQFTGRWIGESQEAERPAHVWEIRQMPGYVLIDNMWEGDPTFRTMSANLVEGEAAFVISETHHAVMVDPQHFIVAAWDQVYDGETCTAEYDVVFSRPGIAELTARQAWTEWKRQGEKAKPTSSES